MDGKDVEGKKQLPTQHQKGDCGGSNGQNFAQSHACAPGLEAAGEQAENVESGKPEYCAPEDVIDAEAAEGNLKCKGTKHEFGSRSAWASCRAQPTSGAACPAILHGF